MLFLYITLNHTSFATYQQQQQQIQCVIIVYKLIVLLMFIKIKNIKSEINLKNWLSNHACL